MVISHASSSAGEAVYSTFSSRYVREELPRYRMPEGSIPKEAAYQIISDELMLDGNPRLNLASFVTTWMEPECGKLMMDSVNKNYVDMDEYPVTTELQNRCVNMIAHLFNAPIGEDETAIGVSTVGSSEAIMLAGLAFKRKWANKMKEQGKPCDKPNIVTGANVQVCWEKFARYFEVELKEVKLTEGYYVMDPKKAIEMVDENTICVAAILGSTLTGEYEDVKLLNDLLVEKNKKTGWVIWRSKDDLPDELIFHINYLGTDQPTFTLNFSKGASQIIAQYYQLIRLGFEGYKHIMENCKLNAAVLKEGIDATGRFDVLSKADGVPLVAIRLKDSTNFSVFDISENLRRFGWIVPAYTMPADAEHVAVLRIVIREDFNRSLAQRLLADINKIVAELDAHAVHAIKLSNAAAAEGASKSTVDAVTEAFKGLAGNKKAGVC
ncbi:unnamed protein product [Triticum turgidum subsp. durum]|uniref:glutamate decarboxylase n=1 Tax=Triticum turgidum subsp. durum TaxID=4567 RepID=A0A9R1Q5S3_TRITD|nr:unnamed protein product [Triticum turgidum subsp. durum]